MRACRFSPLPTSLTLWATSVGLAFAQSSPPNSNLQITRLSTTGTAVIVEFRDTGTGATSYQLESATNLDPGSPASWTEIAGTQPESLGGGQYRFAASLAEFQRAFFRIRTELSAFSDSDADGLDDRWERQHFGSLDSLASSDADGDGYSNWHEYKAGTDPRSSLSQPTLPLVQFVDDQMTVIEQDGVAELNLRWNRAWSGTLQFEVEGTAIEPTQVGPIPRSLGVTGTSAALAVPLHDTDEVLNSPRWVTVRLLDAGGYIVSGNRSLTLRVVDNEQRWGGTFAKLLSLTNHALTEAKMRVLTNRFTPVSFGLEVRRTGSKTTGRLLAEGGLLPQAPQGGFPLEQFTPSTTGDGSLSFDSGWLQLPANSSLLGGITHVRFQGEAKGTKGQSASGSGQISLGSPAQGSLLVVPGTIDLALLPTQFQAQHSTLSPITLAP